MTWRGDAILLAGLGVSLCVMSLALSTFGEKLIALVAGHGVIGASIVLLVLYERAARRQRKFLDAHRNGKRKVRR